MSKDKRGRRWDGKSRVSNDLYRRRFNEIFKKFNLIPKYKIREIDIGLLFSKNNALLYFIFERKIVSSKSFGRSSLAEEMK